MSTPTPTPASGEPSPPAVTSSPRSQAQPSAAEILTAIRDAGWLLERDTETALRASGFHTVLGQAFPDPDDPSVSREIDVAGYRQLFRDDQLCLSVGVRVFAECKQSSMPYVLIGRALDDYTLRLPRLEQKFRFDRVEVGKTPLPAGGHRLRTVDARVYLGLMDLPGNPWSDPFVVGQMTRLDRKQTWLADNRGIFTSLVYPLAKALTHWRSQIKTGGYVDHLPGRDWARIEFYYACVVTSAPIYVVDVTDGADQQPRLSPWATTTRQIKAKNIDGQFYVDVVNASGLPDYLRERITTFTDGVARIASSDPQRFVTREDPNYKWTVD